MKVTAKLRNLRVSPRKVRLVVDLVRGLPVSDAKVQLDFLIKRSSKPISKLLDSALANAKNNFSLDENNLYISEFFVTEGPTLKRIMPRAMGRAFHIRKRTSHVTLALEEINKKDTEAKDESKKKNDKKDKEVKTENKEKVKKEKKVSEKKINKKEPKAEKKAAKDKK